MTDFYESYPHVLDSGTAAAIGRETADELARLVSDTDMARIICRIGELPEGVCDILARDFKVEWYDYGGTLERKRDQIATCIYVHRHKGTTSAVRAAVYSMFRDSEVVEWYNESPPGTPGTFRVVLNDAQGYERARLIRVVEYAKKLSALITSVDLYDKSTEAVGVSLTPSERKSECSVLNLDGAYPVADDSGVIAADDFGVYVTQDESEE